MSLVVLPLQPTNTMHSSFMRGTVLGTQGVNSQRLVQAASRLRSVQTRAMVDPPLSRRSILAFSAILAYSFSFRSLVWFLHLHAASSTGFSQKSLLTSSAVSTHFICYRIRGKAARQSYWNFLMFQAGGPEISAERAKTSAKYTLRSSGQGTYKVAPGENIKVSLYHRTNWSLLYTIRLDVFSIRTIDTLEDYSIPSSWSDLQIALQHDSLLVTATLQKAIIQ